MEERIRVFISVDMEGATGIVHDDQLMAGRAGYERARELLTHDVATAAEAALSMEEVVDVRICDGHGTMRNLLIDRLPAGCEVLIGPAGWKTLCQSEGLDDTFSAMLLVGYHARAGTKNALLAHTWVGRVVHEIRVNGKVFGETALNAATGGEFGVPVVFLSGDDATCREAQADLGDDLVTVAVKKAYGSRAGLCRTPKATEDDIRLGVLTGLQNRAERKPFKVDGPVTFAVGFHTRAQADRGETRPGSERTGEREVTLVRPTYLEAVIDGWKLVEHAAGEHPEWLR